MLDLILTILAIAIGSWIVLGALFLGYPTVQRLKEHRDQLGWISKVPVYFALFFGILADVIFNATWGTVVFREWPKEWTFSERLQRHVNNPRAAKWIFRVNLIDPGHIKL